MMRDSLRGRCACKQRQQAGLIQHRKLEFARLVELGAGLFAGYNVTRLLADDCCRAPALRETGSRDLAYVSNV